MLGKVSRHGKVTRHSKVTRHGKVLGHIGLSIYVVLSTVVEEEDVWISRRCCCYCSRRSVKIVVSVNIRYVLNCRWRGGRCVYFFNIDHDSFMPSRALSVRCYVDTR